MISGSVFSQNQTVEEEPYDMILDSLSMEYGGEKIKTDSILRSGYETSNPLYPKKIDPNYRSKYKGEDFDYTTIKPKESFWDKVKRRISKILEAIFGKFDGMGVNKWTEIILRIFLVLIAGVVLYFLIKLLFDKEGNFIFSKKNKKADISATELHENIHEINFPESILGFEKAKDFRSAIRYQFLFVLKKMTDKNIIHWNPEKTNKDYLKELENTSHKKPYRDLALIFDYVWYGEFEINEQQYQKFKNQFQESGF